MGSLLPPSTPFNMAAVGDKVCAAANGGAILHSIVINKPVATAVVTVYNGTSTTGTKIATIDASQTAVGTLTYDALCQAGIYVVMTVAAADITVCVAA